jgi:hypothetical protein
MPKIKLPKIPEYSEAQRCLEIRRASKRGDLSVIYDREKSKFIDYMLKKYPEWYNCTEKKIWNDTVPFGSSAYIKEKNCEDPNILMEFREMNK